MSDVLSRKNHAISADAQAQQPDDLQDCAKDDTPCSTPDDALNDASCNVQHAAPKTDPFFLAEDARQRIRQDARQRSGRAEGSKRAPACAPMQETMQKTISQTTRRTMQQTAHHYKVDGRRQHKGQEQAAKKTPWKRQGAGLPKPPDLCSDARPDAGDDRQSGSKNAGRTVSSFPLLVHACHSPVQGMPCRPLCIDKAPYYNYFIF